MAPMNNPPPYFSSKQNKTKTNIYLISTKIWLLPLDDEEKEEDQLAPLAADENETIEWQSSDNSVRSITRKSTD